jgi:16S rRNA (uracil1498-N3)-methyltransferase
MATRRVVVPEGSLAVGEVELREDEALYVRDVLRLERGVELLLIDGAGRIATAEIIDITRRAVRVNVRRIETVKEEGGLGIALIQCVAKGEKMDGVVRQATELGVRVIQPAVSERSVARREARLDRWRKIAEDAMRVSGRSFRPQIASVARLDDILARPRAPIALCFSIDAKTSLGAHLQSIALPDLGSRSGEAVPPMDASQSRPDLGSRSGEAVPPMDASQSRPERAEILIGPEGGLSPEEIQRAVASGFSAVSLGPSTLRTETAGPAVVAILLYWSHTIAW